MSNFWDKTKSGARNTFQGDEGSVFWIIQKFIEFLKFCAESINGYLSARRVDSEIRREDDENLARGEDPVVDDFGVVTSERSGEEGDGSNVR